ncbi:hypothetical protein ACIQGT_36690 [Streptomyces sp. NPDC093108]|uniref:hypothetical protein n=1 Tax=Streptomyces sp. NPDC093108 TaxID=3366030 RepID=UPI0037FEC47E
MQADFVRRRVAQTLAATMLAASIIAVGPAVPIAQASDVLDRLNPCNAPGGRAVCDKAKKGAEWLYDKSGADSLVEGVSGAVDFATDPLGYLESKLRSGTKEMFSVFGQELTGKKPSSVNGGTESEPAKKRKRG